MSIETHISPLVEQQFPAFYHEEGPNFIAFVKAYYEFLESEGGAVEQSRKLLDNLDVDKTVDDFTIYFKNQYLHGLPSANKSDQAFSLKHIQDLYKARGTTEAAKLFFRLLYNTDAEILKPGDDILRASDGNWTIPIYLEMAHNQANVRFVGKRITGATSKATAIVESVARRKINGRLLDIMYLSDVRGNFQVDEFITDDGSLENAPQILGSLTSASIIDGRFGIANGDSFSIESDSGKFGEARVVSTVNGSGQVAFNLVEGGSGYSTEDTVVTVSNTVVFHSGNVSANTNYHPSENVSQTLWTWGISSGNSAVLPVGSLVSFYDSAVSKIGTGSVVSINTTSITTSVATGNVTSASGINLTSSPAVGILVYEHAGSSNVRTATTMAINSTAIGLRNISAPFFLHGYMRGATSNALSIATRISQGNGANFSIGSVSNSETVSSKQIGKILSLSKINPGQNYDAPPMVTITNPSITAGGKYDWIVGVANTSGSFIAGQSVQAAAGTTGVIRTANATHLEVRREKYADALANNQQLVSYFANGTVSGVGNIVSVADDTRYLMGNTATVTANATSFAGVVSEVEITDSGFGHAQSANLTFRSLANSEITFTGIGKLERQGVGKGFWSDNRGKLNSDKYIHDNDYYQEYSYEVQTDLSIDKYGDVLKQLMHISGTKMFGSVLKQPESRAQLFTSGSTRTYENDSDFDYYYGNPIVLDFIESKYRSDRIYGWDTDFATLSNMTMSRAHTNFTYAYAENMNGSLVAFEANVPRITSKGLLVEVQRANLLKYSETYGTGTWLLGSGSPTVTQNFATAPNGNQTATRLQAPAGLAGYFQPSSQALTTTPTTYSFYIKDNGGVSKLITAGVSSAAFGGTGGDRSFSFNVQTGLFSGVDAAYTSTQARPLANGWWRVEVTFTPTAAAVANFTCYLTTSNPGDILLWGFQVETGSYATSYIPTTTLSATRAADSISIQDLRLKDPITLFLEFMPVVTGSHGTSSPRLLNIDAGDDTNRITPYFATAGTSIRGFVMTSGVSNADLGVTETPTAGVIYRSAQRYATNDVKVVVDGVASVGDNAVQFPGELNRIFFNATGLGTVNCSCYHRKIIIYPYAMSDVDMQSMTNMNEVLSLDFTV